MTNVRTPKRSYKVHSVANAALVVRQDSGKIRRLTVADVGRTRYDAAVADYWAAKRRVI